MHKPRTDMYQKEKQQEKKKKESWSKSGKKLKIKKNYIRIN